MLEFKNRWICKDGSIKCLFGLPSEPATGSCMPLPRYYRTCKIRKEQQQAIDELYENEKLRLILENISEGIIVANADKKIIIANYMLMKCLELKKMILYLPISQIILNFISLMKNHFFLSKFTNGTRIERRSNKY
jgi:transcriptional regulator with PAS, ATPase and Fis domain